MSETVLEVDDLHCYYFAADGVSRAVDGVSLRLRAGTMFGLVGESGAGKTTLARAVMRAVPPPGRVVSGATRLFGRDLQALSEKELSGVRGREIAMIVPNPRSELNPLLTIGTQLANVVATHRGLNKADAFQRAIELLEQVQMPDPERRARAHPHALSGGMAQRVVIAMALAGEPRVTISDDATSGLDVTVQAQILDLMTGLLRERNAGTLMITRDLGIVANYCDEVAILRRGKLLEVAPVESFFRDARHPYSQQLLAAFSYAEEFVEESPEDEDVEASDEGSLREVGPGHFVTSGF